MLNLAAAPQLGPFSEFNVKFLECEKAAADAIGLLTVVVEIVRSIAQTKGRISELSESHIA